MTTEQKARGLLDILRGNARYTDAAERDVRAIVGFILAIEAEASARGDAQASLARLDAMEAAATFGTCPDCGSVLQHTYLGGDRVPDKG